MSDALRTFYKTLRERSGGEYGIYDLVRDVIRALTRVIGADTAVKTADGGTISATVIQIDQAAGAVQIAGIHKRAALLNDQSIVGTAAWAKSFKTTGAAAAVLSADEKDYEIAMVWVLKDGVPTEYAIFGPEADTGEAEAPTIAQIRAGLKASGVTGLDTDFILVSGRILAARDDESAVALTHLDPAADDTLNADRALGAVL